MLELVVKMPSFYNRKTKEFSGEEPVTLQFEHSLHALSKWESKYEIPFVNTSKTEEQIGFYIECMLLTSNPPDKWFELLTGADVIKLQQYIGARSSATTFLERGRSSDSSTIVTAELLYFYMVHFGIDFEAQYWHLNKLVTLIRVCSEMNKQPEKRSMTDIISERNALNEARKAKYGTNG